MRELTKKHPIEKSVDLKDAVTADEYYRVVYGSFPKWAVVLAGFRHREGLTQKELSEKMHLHQSNVSLMERGKRPIGKNLAKRLSEFFKTDYRLLL